MSRKRKAAARVSRSKQSLRVIQAIGITAIVAGALGIMAIKSTQAADMVVYKSPTCGCCNDWIDHMKEAGFKVEPKNRQNMSPIKAELGVAGNLQSCHTATIGGYVVEGHVPADLVRRMLDEQPDIRGIAVPGMPMGSPGMEGGPYTERYDVVAIGTDGRTSIYDRR
jgi:hypothetical protein